MEMEMTKNKVFLAILLTFHYVRAYDSLPESLPEVQNVHGLQGFIPVGVDSIAVYPVAAPLFASPVHTSAGVPNSDGSYSFSFATNDQARHESSDANGNIQGSFWYVNKVGKHDLSFVAGPKTGFQPTGGSLAVPNGNLGQELIGGPASTYLYAPVEHQVSEVTADSQPSTGEAAYNFKVDIIDYQRQENSDPKGNADGQYSYTNQPSYADGSKPGFQPTSVSLPEKTPSTAAPVTTTPSSSEGSTVSQIKSEDSSYNFNINTSENKKQGISNNKDNVQDKYKYKVANQKNGFGDRLTVRNGPKGKPMTQTQPSGATSSASSGSTANEANASYNINADSYKLQGNAPSEVNVQGQYSYSDEVGQHDLGYVSGTKTGFQTTSGSLSGSNGPVSKVGGIKVPQRTSGGSVTIEPPSEDSLSNTNDGTYLFHHNSPEYQRQQNLNSQENTQGQYTYQNQVGAHDYLGTQTGLHSTAGNLPVPNGVISQTISSGIQSTTEVSISERQSSAGDASYSFNINSANYQRQESADSQGNVQGKYSYTNKAGTHDLTYIAGPKTGFQPTGGSLSLPNGLAPQISSPSDAYTAPNYQRVESRETYQNQVGQHDLSFGAGSETGFASSGGSIIETSTHKLEAVSIPSLDRKVTQVEGGLLKSFIPLPERKKYGYVFETKY
uniref:Lens protein 10 n=1 Tax=Thermonectus marmoratus TaxID=183381 RepID=A0A291S1F2_THEMR|nr:lens protein 10 [Thermonectus marmoratus]